MSLTVLVYVHIVGSKDKSAYVMITYTDDQKIRNTEISPYNGLLMYTTNELCVHVCQWPPPKILIVWACSLLTEPVRACLCTSTIVAMLYTENPYNI